MLSTVGLLGSVLVTLAGSAPAWEMDRDALRVSHPGGGYAISLSAPRLVFEQGEFAGGAAPASIHGDLASGEVVTCDYGPDAAAGVNVEVTLCLQWSAEEQVLRKWARVSLPETAEPVLLREVVLDSWQVDDGAMRIRGVPPQSYPVFGDGFFAGIEFPVAATRIEEGRVLLAHRPGATLRPGAAYETRRAVYGLPAAGDERAAFTAYIARHRPEPRGMHFNYNSWWTSPVPFTEDDIVSIMGAFFEGLYIPHDVSLDTFAIDMGWSNPQSLWEIDPRLFPEGFGRIRGVAERIGSRLGLWISPSAFYEQALDTQWAARNGYETVVIPWGGGMRRLCCLGGARYAAAFRDRLVEMVTREGVRHVKLDGYYLECDAPDHGHAPGVYSAEAVAEGGIRAFAAVRAAAPDTWLEATCFGWNPSPWWLFHVNSVIGTYGDDAPHGRVPCPEYRETYTTARDFFNLQGAAHLPIPVAAQEVLGIIHQSPESLLNDAVMTLLRGHAFVPLYVNPRRMKPRQWAQLARLIAWARENAELLGETEPILPVSWQDGRAPEFVNDAPMPREPYGYAHWSADRGLVALRNPWVAPASVTVPLPESGTPWHAVSIYPDGRAYGEVEPGTALTVRLAPYETRVVSLGHAGGAEPRVEPRGPDRRTLQVGGLTCELTRVEYEHEGPALGPDWTASGETGTQAVRLQASARVRSGANYGHGHLLVILEGNQTPAAPHMQIEADGAPLTLELIATDGGFAASSIAPTEHWACYGADLPRPDVELSIRLETGGDCSRLSVWVADYTLPHQRPDSTLPLPVPERRYLDAAAILPLTGVADIAEPVREPVKVTRIDGVYLDTLTPETVTQGWGELQRNQSVWGRPIVIAGEHFRRGLGTHAPAEITCRLDGTYRRFEAFAGVNAANNGTVTFEVRVDGASRWRCGLRTRDMKPKPVVVDIAGAQTLTLVVGDGGDGIAGDHADWADAKLLR